MPQSQMIFHQLFETQTSTYTYLLADPISREAVIIDPVFETQDRDFKLIQELDLKLKYILDTHIHADHITGAAELRKKTGAKSAVSRWTEASGYDMHLEEGQSLQFGPYNIQVLETPGHTDSCLSYLCEDKIFTGDALLIRGSGRTDFQQGSSEKLFDSVHKKIFSLPSDTQIFPGHDYRGLTHSTVELEKKYNPRLGMGHSKADFIKIMNELKLAHPKKIHESVPANLLGGIPQASKKIRAQIVDGTPEIHPSETQKLIGQVRIVDVRGSDEFTGELGHIPKAELVTLGEDLTTFLNSLNKDEEIVFVCRSGGRSGAATQQALKLGIQNVANMQGGMILWNELKLQVEK